MENAHVQAAVNPRRAAAAWACRVVAMATLAAGAWILMGDQAAAGSAPVVQEYACQLPVVGDQLITVSIGWPDLRTATVGVPTPRLPVNAMGTAPAIVRTLVSFIGATWVDGNADVTAEVVAPQGDITKTMTLTVPRTNVSEGSGPLAVPAAGILPSLDLMQPGSGHVAISGVELHLTPLTSSGGPTWFGQMNISCALEPGQSNIVASFQVLPAPTASPRPSPAATKMRRADRRVTARPLSIGGQATTLARPPARSTGNPRWISVVLEAMAGAAGALATAVLIRLRDVVADWVVARVRKLIRSSLRRPGSIDDTELPPTARHLAKIIRDHLQDEHKRLEVATPKALPVCWEIDSDCGADVMFENVSGDIAATYGNVPAGRLVVLGGPGSGKSVLIQRLALALLGDPEQKKYLDSGEPVPVIFDMRPWDRDTELDNWLIGQLMSLHYNFVLREELARKLVCNRHVLPVLDGFDKIKPDLRVNFLETLNNDPDRRIVLASRYEEYRDAVRGDEKNNGVVLSEAAVIKLADLSLGDSLRYLQELPYRRRGMPAWKPVADKIGREQVTGSAAILAEVLRTPRMVALARDVYRRRDPAELLQGRFISRDVIEAHLRGASQSKRPRRRGRHA